MDDYGSDADTLAGLFKALSSETRTRMLQLLKRRSLCVGALAARLDITQSAASQHLQVLKNARLVTAERRGYYVHYRPNEEALARCKDLVDDFLNYEEPAENWCAEKTGVTHQEQKGGD